MFSGVRTPVPPGRWPRGRAELSGRTLPEAWAHRWAADPDTPVLLDGRDPGRILDGAALGERTSRLAAAL
ncbi:MAG TPA: hypothetical protein VEH82_05565, partial [Acidimicrobiales bacterium]|nr:hypothetical protein [Acidimicrobiales bacterium]